MIVDLHAHYPMHVRGRLKRLWLLIRSGRGLPSLANAGRWFLVGLISRFKNYRNPFSGPRVKVSYMKEGEVEVALSVLYSAWDEWADRPPPEPPRDRYVKFLLDQLEAVEDDLAGRPDAAIALRPSDLMDAIDAEKVALVHCVEGGFHLGEHDDEVRDAVNLLADRGVAYITVAHLYWRQVASSANALPFLTDEEYREKYDPHEDLGLCDRARAAIETMADRRVLVDISHMSKRSIEDTFELLDADVPVLATHGGFRFGEQDYMLDEQTLWEIRRRDGLVGLIMAQHQIYDGGGDGYLRSHGFRLRKRKRFEESFELLCRHIDMIRCVTGSNRHVAIGSDFDGFIKPTLAGIQDMRDMKRLREALEDEYREDAELICSGNAMRLLTGYWGGAPGPGPGDPAG